jgi:hypothetical protein
MRIRLRLLLIIVLVVTTASSALAAPADVTAAVPGPGGFRAWTGAQASSFSVPGDVQVVWEYSNAALGLT